MKGSDRLLRSAEQIIRPVSWATLPLLIALPLLRYLMQLLAEFV